ncbi:hypothetical protein CYL31_15165 [Marinomonas sp. A3A]|jgi:hypothetical protein|uniref:hypothetical protein n=1 Tax=Marinomonas sp. A3A TaxID=2065312 RepID=UPI001BB309AE|nr:hypothetical protein [Marinomonas sp. A3A]QUX92653.1 hypothetical protein CYL31_15165 [Marinomonas sp. A3A]|mmetsp:Transcript_2255/g.212  ORF Transcript_2255/g.212 Transcript_2255/m.212 type:complete len:303 (+) Transcript_2255:310-1218(+)
MKAIKLASVFAVSAVAAAVSTATFAAETVFTGTAGLEYQWNQTGQDQSASRGEVNIIGDTGLVYFKVDMEGSSNKKGSGTTENDPNEDTTFSLDAIYVKQGAVQFGDFDGSLIDKAAFSAGVEEDNDDAKYVLGNKLGVRYAVNDSLTIAVESKENDNMGTLSASYKTEFSGLTLGVSGGYKMTSDDAKEGKILTVGVSAPLGMATLTTFVQAGTQNDLDILNTGIGLDVALSEQLSLAVQYYTEGGEELDTTTGNAVDLEDKGITEATVYYTAGDVTYYASYLAYEADDSDYSVVGAKVSF